MKRVINFILIATLVSSCMLACKKQETLAYFNGGDNPVLTGTANSGGSVINLNAADSAKPGLSLRWTNPNYTFNYGVSSLSVSYIVEIDTAGSNFTNPNRFQIGISQVTDSVLSESVINAGLANQMKLDTSMFHNLEVRVAASINTQSNGAGTVLYSNVLNFTAKPFYPPPAVNPPASGELYIVGSATLSWNNPVDDPSVQQFTQVTPTHYQLVTQLIGDGEYKFISVNGSWDADKQWSIKTEQNSGDASTLSYTLYPNGGNVRAPLQSGTYLIDVDFQTGKATLTQQ